MVTKEERSQELNKKLNTSIDWSRLLEEDLKNLDDMIESGEFFEKLAKYLVTKKGKERIDEEIKNWAPGKYAAKLLT